MTQKEPADLIAGHVVDVRPGQRSTCGGLKESAEKAWQVNPTGPEGVTAVTTVIPEQKNPSVARKVSGVH
nr:hypothetical protein [Streptosporangium nondiastaticum]